MSGQRQWKTLCKAGKSRSDLTVAPKWGPWSRVLTKGVLQGNVAAPVLGGPEDEVTHWLLGYMHVSDLIEVIRSPLCWNQTVFCQVTGLWWVCVVSCAAIALESLSGTRVLKYKCCEARLVLSTCPSAFLHQDVEATLNCSWCVLHVKIFLGG